MHNEKDNQDLVYDGHCAFAVSTGKTNVEGGKHFLVKDGKKYVFSNFVAKLLFSILPNRIAKANEVWNKKTQQNQD